jgi:hypothetical protein
MLFVPGKDVRCLVKGLPPKVMIAHRMSGELGKVVVEYERLNGTLLERVFSTVKIEDLADINPAL